MDREIKEGDIVILRDIEDILNQTSKGLVERLLQVTTPCKEYTIFIYRDKLCYENDYGNSISYINMESIFKLSKRTIRNKSIDDILA